MRPRLRAFFLCLLFVILPIQSIAGITRYQCSLMHHSPPTGVTAQGEHSARIAMANVADADDCDDMRVASASGGLSSDDNCEHTDPQKRSSCGTCSACCIGSYAPPPFFLVSPAQVPEQLLPPPSISSFAEQIPARLERPPRTTAAVLS